MERSGLESKRPTNAYRAPALQSNAVKFEVRRFPQNYRGSVFAGDPSPELDLAWHNLFEGMVRLTIYTAANLTAMQITTFVFRRRT